MRSRGKVRVRKEFVFVLVFFAVVGAAAAYAVTSISSQTAVQEAVTVTEVTPLAASMYPGETNTWTFTVSNAAPDVNYTITLIPNVVADSGVNAIITSVTVDGTEITPDQSGNYVFTLYAGSTSTVDVTIQVTSDSAPGTVSVSMTVDRA